MSARRSAQLLSIEEAAEALGVTPRMIRRLTASRRLPFVKVGRLVRFREADIGRFVDESTVPAINRRSFP
jgi:excisionase family DNA binding protein